jgi:hypothetical protein
MSDVNELIRRKLKAYSHDVQELAFTAIKLSDSGLPEASISEQLESVVRQIVRREQNR